ncbi:MAG: hypothetical protein LBV18_05980 [Alistipes sp.]|jgi:hypothetical protein|nr:hypothetical protein [Alistipes sp.]
MKAKSTILAALGAVAILAGCKDDPGDKEPIVKHNTDHPDHGKVTFAVTWPADAPETYTVVLGDESASLSGTQQAEFPELMDEGDTDYAAYNEPQGVTFAGAVATVDVEGGFAVSPDWLWSDRGSVAIKKDTDHLVPLDMEPQVRQLNLSVEFEGAQAGEVEIVAARLTGAAQTLDLKTGLAGGATDIAPLFTSADGIHTATHNLLGVVGETQTLELIIELPSGEEATLTSDVTEALAGFNSNKTKSLDVELTAANVTLGGAILTVAGWKDGEIRGGGRENPTLGTQIELSWPGMDDRVEVVELHDSRGMIYTSPVENGKTVGLYELPAEIYKMNVFAQGEMSEVTLNILSYDNQTGAMVLTDEYNITRPFHFGLITDMAGTYYVRGDIDCAGTTVAQVGHYNSDADCKPFTGVIDGGGYKIVGLKLAVGANQGIVAVNDGVIKNLEIAKLETGNLGDQRTATVTGTICAVNRGTIENCVNRAVIQGSSQIGGLVGINRGVITDCENHAEVIGISQGGGIAGTNAAGATITDCDNAGNVMGNVKNGGIAGENFGDIAQVTNSGVIQAFINTSGGIVGVNDGGKIENATNSGRIAGGKPSAGGIAGSSIGTGNGIAHCLNTGDVAGGPSTGGIVGQGSAANVTDCENRGAVTGAASTGGTVANGTGGIIGHGTGVTVMGCENSGGVSGAQSTGGVAGANAAGGSIMYCENRGTVTGSGSETGGIVGNASGGIIGSCVNHPTGSVTGAANNAGGIAGVTGTGSVMSAVVIQNCWNMATVSAGNQYVGGIVANSTGSIIACKNSGNVSLVNEFGPWSAGIAAVTAARHNLTACYNTGDIKGWSNKGGIVGQVSMGMASVVTASYNVGELLLEDGDMANATPFQSRNGGVVGWNANNGQVLDCYWDFEAANWVHEPVGIGENPNTNAAQVTVSRFTYDAVDPVWPTEDKTGWGVTADNGADGRYWSSLGNAATAVYPTLWWEPAGGELLIGVDAMPAN